MNNIDMYVLIAAIPPPLFFCFVKNRTEKYLRLQTQVKSKISQVLISYESACH